MKERVAITGIGVVSSIGNDLNQYRSNLLLGKSKMGTNHIDGIGTVPVGLCDFDDCKHSTSKERKRGTRSGAISIYCAGEAIADAKIDIDEFKNRVGVYIGISEHGSSELEEELKNLHKKKATDNYWSPFHMPRIIANAPAGEVCLAHKIHGPHMTLGGACAAGNLGILQGAQMLQLGEIDFALAGGVSNSTSSTSTFKAFHAINGLASHEDANLASRPLDKNRNGIVISEGGAILVLERLNQALKRNAPIYGEIIGYSIKTDAVSFVEPSCDRQVECMNDAIQMANIKKEDIDLINMHATGTQKGDITESEAIYKVFGENQPYVNSTKGHLGHAMGAAGTLEVVANILSFRDSKIHHCLNLEHLDEKILCNKIVTGKPILLNKKIDHILFNSFGMLGINSSIIIKRFDH